MSDGRCLTCNGRIKRPAGPSGPALYCSVSCRRWMNNEAARLKREKAKRRTRTKK